MLDPRTPTRQKSKQKLIRSPGSVFVNVVPPERVQQQLRSNSYHNDWTAAANEIGNDPEPTIPEAQPTAEALFESYLPRHIEASRWGRYISPGPEASRIFDNTTLVYHDPCLNFWDLYGLGKGIFRKLGIYLSKRSGVWEAHIPIRVLTDKVFIESGLAGVEKMLLKGTGIDPCKILADIRRRQYQKTKDGMARVKRARAKEAVADAIGLIAIIATSWAAYVVGGC